MAICPVGDRGCSQRRTDVNTLDFLANIDTSSGDDACHKWKGSTDGEYGHVRVRGKESKPKVHRRIWEIHNGPIPKGYYVLHAEGCKRECCNIKHLRLGTQAENMQQASREGHLGHEYSDEECMIVVTLRFLYGMSYAQIAKRFSPLMTHWTASRICKRMHVREFQV